MSNRPRPVLLGYIRAGVLGSAAQVERIEAQLFDFADREEFCLGTVYVERGMTTPAFHSLMAELAHDDAAWGVVIPDPRHLTGVERQLLRGHDEGVQTRIVVVSFSPPPVGPVWSPLSGPGCRTTTALGPRVPRSDGARSPRRQGSFLGLSGLSTEPGMGYLFMP